MFKLPLNLADGKYHYTGIKGLQHIALPVNNIFLDNLVKGSPLHWSLACWRLLNLL